MPSKNPIGRTVSASTNSRISAEACKAPVFRALAGLPPGTTRHPYASAIVWVLSSDALSATIMERTIFEPLRQFRRRGSQSRDNYVYALGHLGPIGAAHSTARLAMFPSIG